MIEAGKRMVPGRGIDRVVPRDGVRAAGFLAVGVVTVLATGCGPMARPGSLVAHAGPDQREAMHSHGPATDGHAHGHDDHAHAGSADGAGRTTPAVDASQPTFRDAVAAIINHDERIRAAFEADDPDAARGAATKIDRALARLDLVKPARQRAAVADDILSLVCGMLAVFAWPRVEVRLDLTDEQSCPKFHCDNVIVRLVTTYVGPGTEYVERHAADTVHRVAPGSLVLLKGHRHPTHTDSVLHRSPPLRPGTRRLCVAIDRADWLTDATPDPAIDHTGALT